MGPSSGDEVVQESKSRKLIIIKGNNYWFINMVVAFQTITGALPSRPLSYLDRIYFKYPKETLNPLLRSKTRRQALLAKHLNHIRREEGVPLVSNPLVNVWRVAQDENEREIFGRLDEKKEKYDFPPRTIRVEGYKRKVEVIGNGGETIVFKIEGFPKVVFKVLRRQVGWVDVWEGSNFEDQVVYMTIIDQILAKRAKTKIVNGFELEKIPRFPALAYLNGIREDLGLIIQERCYYYGGAKESGIRKINKFLTSIDAEVQDGFKEYVGRESTNVFHTKAGELVIVDGGSIAHAKYLEETEEGLEWKKKIKVLT